MIGKTSYYLHRCVPKIKRKYIYNKRINAKTQYCGYNAGHKQK